MLPAALQPPPENRLLMKRRAARRYVGWHTAPAWLLIAAALLAPGAALACACGCGIFDVGTHSAPAADNPDKAIRSTFVTVGGQYQFNRFWGVSVEVPL